MDSAHHNAATCVFPNARGPVPSPRFSDFVAHMLAISRSTRASTAANGSLHRTVRWAWSLSLRWTESTVKSRLCAWAARMKSPQLGSGRLWGKVLGFEDLDVRTDAGSVSATLQQIEEATLAVDVVVGKIELGDPGTGQRQVVLGGVPRDQLVLDDPVDLRAHQSKVPCVDRDERPVPQIQDALVAQVIQPLAVDERRGPFVVLGLDLYGAQLATVSELDLLAASQVMADLADGPDRVLQRQVRHRHTGLKHPKHQIGRADLEHRGRLAHVGVTHDDVQPAVLLGVGVRLVPRVDDGPRTRGGAGDALPDVVRPLTQAVCRPACRGRDLA